MGRAKSYRAAGIEDLDSVERSLLSNTVGLGTNGTSNVSAVAVAIGVGAIASVVGEEGSTALEVGVGSVDTRVNDVGAGTGTSGGVVDVRGRALFGVGDTAKTVWGTALGGKGPLLNVLLDVDGGLDDGVLLNVLDLGKILAFEHCKVWLYLRWEEQR